MAREGNGLTQSHTESLMAKPPAPDPLHILTFPSLVLVWQSPDMAALSSELLVEGKSKVRLGFLSPSLCGDSVYPVVFRMGQWRGDRIWRKEIWLSGLREVSALSVNLSFLN